MGGGYGGEAVSGGAVLEYWGRRLYTEPTDGCIFMLSRF